MLNRDSPDEPRFEAYGSDLSAFPEGPSVLVAGRLIPSPEFLARFPRFRLP